MFGPSTLNSNRNNHKLLNKLANQKRRHMSLELCWIRTRYCALIRRRSIQKVYNVCDAGKVFADRRFFFVLWELIFAIRTLVFLGGNSFFWRFSESTQYPALKIFSILLIKCNRNTYYKTVSHCILFCFWNRDKLWLNRHDFLALYFCVPHLS